MYEANIGVYFGLLLLRNHYQGMAPSGPNPLEIYPGDLTRSVRMVRRVWRGPQDPNLGSALVIGSVRRHLLLAPQFNPTTRPTPAMRNAFQIRHTWAGVGCLWHTIEGSIVGGEVKGAIYLY